MDPPPQLIDEPAGTQGCINSKSCMKRNTTLSQIIVVGADLSILSRKR